MSLNFSTGHWKILLDLFPTRPSVKKNYAAEIKSAIEQKEEAARLAAASYSESADLDEVVKEYSSRIGKKYSQESHEILWEEMLSILPNYRYPSSSDVEIFLGEGGQIRGTAFIEPPFLKEIMGVCNNDLFKAVRNYVYEAENEKNKLISYKEKYQELEMRLDGAYKIFKESGGRPDKKNAAIVRQLEFSRGMPRKRIDERQVYGNLEI